jgi:malto-oligosyltrehalose trehalohydrolase
LVAQKKALNPFGARLLPTGGVKFRLWAPAAKTVDLVIGRKCEPMERSVDGWYEAVEPRAKAGTRYQYRINGELIVPDPASRFQPKDAEGPSEVIDPLGFKWQQGAWRGMGWEKAVIYELHVGTFTPEGSYAGVAKKLNGLKKIGVTAIELMPLADFPGRRNWGYDGVLPYAPDSRYGRPEDLKALVQAAHRAGLMVLLDVVYNHFGPKGNFLNAYAPQFFNESNRTPWGAAINFDGAGSHWVREYFIHNALYWLEEYRFDGLRFDAVHAIVDHSAHHVLEELASRVPKGKHLVLENDANQARFIGPGKYTAQWNDDSHHAYHVLATGETHGYYIAYADAPARHLARCLAEGFAYQGEVSPFTQRPRGEKSSHLPPTAFVDFLQNHDQIGNRAFGERLVCLSDERKLKALSSILLLAPSPPLLFMGEEWGCRQPFLFFCDFSGALGEAVRKGRRAEFPQFKDFVDPLAESTFRKCVLDWKKQDRGWLAHYNRLLQLRKKTVSLKPGPGRYRMLGERAFEVAWDRLTLIANCGDQPVKADVAPRGKLLWGETPSAQLQPWTVSWWLDK